MKTLILQHCDSNAENMTFSKGVLVKMCSFPLKLSVTNMNSLSRTSEVFLFLLLSIQFLSLSLRNED